MTRSRVDDRPHMPPPVQTGRRTLFPTGYWSRPPTARQWGRTRFAPLLSPGESFDLHWMNHMMFDNFIFRPKFYPETIFMYSVLWPSLAKCVLCVCACLSLPSNLYRQIMSYGMMMWGVMGKQISYRTLSGVCTRALNLTSVHPP